MDKWKQIAGLFAVCTVMMATPFSASAATINNATLLQHGPGSETAQYLVKVTADSAVISTDVDGENLLLTADKDDEFPLLEKSDEDGWLKVQVGDEEGYLLDESSASLEEAEEEELETAAAAAGESLSQARQRAAEQEAAAAAANRRQALVQYAMQFLGCRYRDAGTSPATGFDCSGFTYYIMKTGAGLTLPRSSRTQANAGIAVSVDQMQPGDLLFYGGSVNSINHVGMYIGNGQIIHASTYSTGVKLSPWNYRTPVKIVNVLG